MAAHFVFQSRPSEKTGRILKILFCFLFACFFLQSCVTAPPPKLEYTIAKAAIDAARTVQAVRYSPGNWHQAEEFYRQGKIFFSERQNELALDLFEKARLAAERAENSARLLRQKNGDIL